MFKFIMCAMSAIVITIFIIGPTSFLIGTVIAAEGSKLLTEDPTTSMIASSGVFLFFVLPVVVIHVILYSSWTWVEKVNKERAEKMASMGAKRRRQAYSKSVPHPALPSNMVDGEFTEVD